MRDRTATPTDPAAELAALPAGVRSAAVARLQTLTATLAADGGQRLEDTLGGAVDVGRHDVVWLCLAVLHGALPDEQHVLEGWRYADLEGAPALLARELRSLRDATHPLLDVEVVTGEVLVDVDRTARFDTATGIQRVVRELAARWAVGGDCRLVAWADGHTGLRALSSQQHARATATDRLPRPGEHDDVVPDVALVPWGGTYVLPELSVETPRNDRLRALGRFSTSRVGVVGFDCIAVTSAETTDHGVAGDVAWNLSAVKHADVVAAISAGAATEYQGFCTMLSAQGLAGPRVVDVMLPSQAREVTAEELAAGSRAAGAGHLPTVLVVGSHEPRKNHLAVLHAAEILWRSGHRFFLTFIGGAGWRSEQFDQQVEVLVRAGRPVHVLRAADETVLWSAYRTARAVVFPSLHEGFGLPIAEALSVGTPVVTSDFGSMLELARDGGALLVDPHDDAALAEAVGRLLVDDELHRRLSQQALARPRRRWDDYARDVWSVVVEDGPAPGPSTG